MNSLVLTGLRGDHPLGFLAALGALRACADLDGFREARLSWRDAGGWRAVLHTAEVMTTDALVAGLCNRATGRAEVSELAWADTPRVSADIFRAALGGLEAWSEGKAGQAEHLPAQACDAVPTGEDVATTAFLVTSGRQLFLREARGAVGAVAKGQRVSRGKKAPEELFRECLLGPWRYEDLVHSLGWDPSTERLHALRARSPTSERSRGVLAAVALAVDALPLFPVVSHLGRPATTAFHRFGSKRIQHLTWPVWDAPLGVPTVRSLLSLPELVAEKPPATVLRARGVTAVFKSERYKLPTQGAYYILRPVTQYV
jgi:hypothetical protein